MLFRSGKEEGTEGGDGKVGKGFGMKSGWIPGMCMFGLTVRELCGKHFSQIKAEAKGRRKRWKNANKTYYNRGRNEKNGRTLITFRRLASTIEICSFLFHGLRSPNGPALSGHHSQTARDNVFFTHVHYPNAPRHTPHFFNHTLRVQWQHMHTASSRANTCTFSIHT